MVRITFFALIALVLSIFPATAQVIEHEVFRVTAVKKGDGSTRSVSNTVKLDAPFRLYIPNAFSPNVDGHNEGFGVKGSGISNFDMKIYSRWGELLFETSDPLTNWDGTYQGVPVAEGVYVYQIQALGKTGQHVLKGGTITLIR